MWRHLRLLFAAGALAIAIASQAWLWPRGTSNKEKKILEDVQKGKISSDEAHRQLGQMAKDNRWDDYEFVDADGKQHGGTKTGGNFMDSASWRKH